MTTEETLRKIEALLDGARESAQGDIDAWIEAAREAHHLALEADAPPDVQAPLLARALAELSSAHNQQSDFEASLRYGREALAVCREWDLRELSVHCLILVGWCHLRMAHFSGALQAYREGLRLAVELGDPSLESRIQNATGVLLLEMEDYPAAAEAGRRSVELSREAGETKAEAAALNSLGNALMRDGDLDGAERCLRKSIALLFDDEHATREKGYQLATWGEILIHRGDLEEARKKLEYARGRFCSEGDRFGEAFTLMHLGRVHQGFGEYDEAAQSISAALSLAVENEMTGVVVECHAHLHGAYKEAGHLEKALAHHESYHRVNKEMFSEQADRRLKALQVEHDFESARQQAEIHRLRTEELERAVGELEETKDALETRMEELCEANHRIRELSIRDGLTGTYNRRHLDAFLGTVFRETERYGRPLSVALFDVDDFKQINDRFSHGIGDDVLRAVARIFSEECRGSDCVARYGGEEFVLVMPETDVEACFSAAERIRRRIGTNSWEELHPELRVTVSAGVASYEGQANHELLLRVADEMLYLAKSRGKDAVRRTDSDPDLGGGGGVGSNHLTLDTAAFRR